MKIIRKTHIENNDSDLFYTSRYFSV